MARRVTKTNENALAPLRAELPLVAGGATASRTFAFEGGKSASGACRSWCGVRPRSAMHSKADIGEPALANLDLCADGPARVYRARQVHGPKPVGCYRPGERIMAHGSKPIAAATSRNAKTSQCRSPFSPPQFSGRRRSPFYERLELRPGNLRVDAAAEAAVARSDNPLAA
jgi:hypothetical protein